jgi:hypothetical protein
MHLRERLEEGSKVLSGADRRPSIGPVESRTIDGTRQRRSQGGHHASQRRDPPPADHDPGGNNLITLPADADLRKAVNVFYSHAIRRLPLVEDGRMVGMLTVDDLVIDFVNDLDSLVRPVFGQVVFGTPDSSPV